MLKKRDVVFFLAGAILSATSLVAFKLCFNGSKTVDMKVTAYCPCERCCGKYANGKTAIGKDVRTPGVAADPKLLPYGTKLNIPGIGILAVDDTGGAMRQDGKKGIYHIDVRFPNHEKALNWGVRYLPVEILN